MGAKLTTGVNDLLTKLPDLAKEAFGWDPSAVCYGSRKVLPWKGICGHIWETEVCSRSTKGHGCPYCSGKKILLGFNDLATIAPALAKEAYNWNPQDFTSGSNAKVLWKGKCGHIWNAQIKNRYIGNTGCPYCAGQAVLPGFNDLATIAPDVAQYVHDWDPSTVTAYSGVHRLWKCHCGYEWKTTPSSMMFSRNIGTNGCHACSRRNFCFNDDAYLYLMQRDGEQQIGITNNPANRLKRHYRNGWNLIEIVGPADAAAMHSRELGIKRWIQKRVGCIAGTKENWSQEKLCVSAIADLEWRIAQDLGWGLTGR